MAKLAERLLEGTLVYVQGELNTRDRQRTIKVPNGNALIEAVVKQPEVEVEADLIRILDRRRGQPRLSDRSGQSDSKDTRVEFSRMEVKSTSG